VRDTGLRRDLDDLDAAGLDVTLMDLREPAAVANLATYDIVWVRGGNVFVLRQVLANTGTDIVLLDLLHRNAVVYGGYSAGACVLAPDLTGLALVDDPAAVAEPIYGEVLLVNGGQTQLLPA
jgi:dipeptidase E